MTCHHRSATSAEQLFRDHHAHLVATLERHLEISTEMAEDACSRAWEQLLRCQPDGDRLDRWLFTVAKHEAFELLKRRQRETPVAEPKVGGGHDLAEVLDARDTLRLLGCLKPQQRTVLWLRGQGYSYAAITEITGQTFTWVNRHVAEGRRELRRRLEVA